MYFREYAKKTCFWIGAGAIVLFGMTPAYVFGATLPSGGTAAEITGANNASATIHNIGLKSVLPLIALGGAIGVSAGGAVGGARGSVVGGLAGGTLFGVGSLFLPQIVISGYTAADVEGSPLYKVFIPNRIAIDPVVFAVSVATPYMYTRIMSRIRA